MLRKSFVVGIWPKSSRRIMHKLVSFFMVCLLIGTIYFSAIHILPSIFSMGNRFLQNQNIQKLVSNNLRTVISQGMPVIRYLEVKNPLSAAQIINELTYDLIDLKFEKPQAYLKSQLSYIEQFESRMEKPVSSPQPHTVPNEDVEGSSAGEISSGETIDNSPADEESASMDFVSKGNPLVGIYTTHNAETYLPTDGVKRVSGENGGIVKVAAELESSLEEGYEVPVIRSEVIHDYPNWDLSYTNSKETAKEMLSENPTIQVVADIHRDAGFSEKKFTEIDGKNAAQILFIVGSDQRLDNPNWKKNKEFAALVHSKMEELYPGLSRGVRVQNGRYNQHLHPRSVLVEIGNTKNTLEEAKYSAQLLAHVFHEVLKEISQNTL